MREALQGEISGAELRPYESVIFREVQEMNEVALQPYTLEKCHEFWREYVADPNMMDTEYTYSPEWVEKYYHGKVQEPDRRFLPCAWGIRSSGRSP